MNTTNVFLSRAVLTRLGNGPSTDAALAAQLCVDLALVQAVLRDLACVGRIEQVGVLWQVATPRAAA